ncbi:hypothetical protein PIGBHMHK_00637 [Mycoplasmopsis arginini]|uniref:hypothetical protein n=1 Tax=Mycoplasmopsis arginini TaxID=2094 RepID=UPI00249F18FE|nr:hypothetical protein [Mycoplasmopsis arginini]MDI3349073.1 hypothetical protein [Mycoplasmopsis arginini]
MKIIILTIALFITGCEQLKSYKLSKNGIAGYKYCIANPKEKLYMDDDVFNCEYYLLRYKDEYKNSIY